MISAILLAAGQSRRFGSGQKLLQHLRGRPLVVHSAELIAGAPVEELIVVIDRPELDNEIARALDFVQPRFVVAAGGMASSLAAGVGALDPASEAVLVALGDEPLVDVTAVERVVERYRSGGAEVVVPRYRGTRGHPVLFGRSVYPELLELSGDRGARGVADRDPSRLAFVDLDLPKPIDVDTPEDLARVVQQLHDSSP